MKKEVSDHLAKVFFETRPAEKIKESNNFIFFIVLSLSLVSIFVFGATFLADFGSRGKFSGAEYLTLEHHGGPYVLKFDFSNNASQIAALDVDVPETDIRRFARLGFIVRIKDTDTHKQNTLKVTLVNKRRETSSLYITEIGNSWKRVVVPFSPTNKSQDWSCLVKVSFSLEPWNMNAQKGELLIDSVQFLKN